MMPARVLKLVTVHEGWASFRVASVELSDGTVIRREVEDHGRAVAVLPYDPERKVAMLARQLRVPLLVAADEQESLEVPAGILESGDPAACARREAAEECGLDLGMLEHVVTAWTMPGISTERIDLFLAAYAADHRNGHGGGLADEHENIVCVEFALVDLAAMADRGEINDMKTFTLILALRLRHPELFAASAVPGGRASLSVDQLNASNDE
jgi:nudix-type nucleoside diphosphatase (YffH/AdpP family)